MATARHRLTDYYRTSNNLTAEEAEAQVTDLIEQETSDQLLQRPPEDLTWCDLDRLAKQAPALAIEAWENIKDHVREEYRSGRRAARALEAHDTDPHEIAEFLVLRDEFSEQHRPRNGVERALVDMMAQAYSSYLFWTQRLTAYSHLEPKAQAVKDEGRWSPPRVEHSKAVDQAAAMADRFHRMFARTLKSLRDQRRYSPTLIVQTQQLNMAQQQCNVIGDQADCSGLLSG